MHTFYKLMNWQMFKNFSFLVLSIYTKLLWECCCFSVPTPNPWTCGYSRVRQARTKDARASLCLAFRELHRVINPGSERAESRTKGGLPLKWLLHVAIWSTPNRFAQWDKHADMWTCNILIRKPQMIYKGTFSSWIIWAQRALCLQYNGWNLVERGPLQCHT